MHSILILDLQGNISLNALSVLDEKLNIEFLENLLIFFNYCNAISFLDIDINKLFY